MLVRTRLVAGICAALMLVALAGAAFGWVNYRRAHRADLAAQQARSDAEKLVGFLIEDFYAELQPTGRIETMGKLARMAVSYYDGLPGELLTPQTQIYHGMALIREAGAALAGDDLEAGGRSLTAARSVFEKLRADGDTSEPVTLGLALALFTPFSSLGPGGGPLTKREDLQHAADLLRPLVEAGKSSRQVRLVYADILNYLSHRQPKEAAIASCEEARRILVGLGALDLSDLEATSIYADTSDSQARHSVNLGRLEDAARLEQEVYDLAEKVLAKRPGDLRSMANRALAADVLGTLAARRYDYAASAEYAAKAEQAGERYVAFNPADVNSWVYWVRGKDQLADTLLEQGRVQDATGVLRSAVALEKDERAPGGVAALLNFTAARLAALEARGGRAGEAEASLEAAVRMHKVFVAVTPEDSFFRSLESYTEPAWRARLQLLGGDDRGAFVHATAVADAVRHAELPAENVTAPIIRGNFLRQTLTTAAAAAIRLERYAEAESATRERLELPADFFSGADPENENSRARAMLAHAVLKQARAVEAREILQPALEHYRQAQKAGAGGLSFRQDFAYALYVSALAAGPADRGAHDAALAEAARLIAGQSAEGRRLADVRELAAWIAAARGGPTPTV
jgi:hypothetical protein